MKKIKLLIVSGMAALALIGCQASNNADSADNSDNTTTESTQTSSGDDTKADENGNVYEMAGWKITLEDVQTEKEFANISEELGYSSVDTSEFAKTASDGNKFCMIKMIMEKQDSTDVIDWENVILTDSDANEYKRMDDSFISDLGMMRMAGTTLNFGTNEGWLCFEIKDTAKDCILKINFKDDTMEIPLN